MARPFNPSPNKEAQAKGLEKMLKKNRQEVGKLGGQISQENRKQRKGFKLIFEEYLTASKEEEIAKDFIDVITDKSVKVADRIKAFELLLRVTQELDTLSKTDLNALKEVIQLKLD